MQLSGQFRVRAAGGFVLALGSAVLWSFIGPVSKEILAIGVSPLEIAFWRALLGGFCFFAQAALAKKLFIPIRHAAIFVLFGVLGIGVFFGALQISIHLSGAATAMVLMYTAPIWVAFEARLFFNEKITTHKTVAILTALAGTIFICISGGSIPSEYSVVGIICGLITGVAYASHFPFLTWWGKLYSIETIYSYMFLGGVISIWPFISFIPDKTVTTWGWLIALAFLTTYLAYIAFAESLKRISQIQAAVIGNIEPLLSTLWVWMLFNESFDAIGWLGCILIAAAVFSLAIRRKSS